MTCFCFLFVACMISGLAFSTLGQIQRSTGNDNEGDRQLAKNRALVDAIKNENDVKVEQLLNDGADVNTRAEDYNTRPVLLVAVSNRNSKIVAILLNYSAYVNATDDYGDTALHEAAYIGQVNIVSLLLNHSAYIDAKNNRGFTPLHRAAYWGRKSVALLLIKSGADVFAKNDYRTVLDEAKTGSDREVVELIQEKQRELSGFSSVSQSSSVLMPHPTLFRTVSLMLVFRVAQCWSD